MFHSSSDGTTLQITEVDPFTGKVSFTVADHRYEDDMPQGTCTISATLTSEDLGMTATTSVKINNVAPVVDTLELMHPKIDEDGWVTVSGRFSDVGLRDAHSVLIDWGDGEAPSAATVTQEVGGGVYTARHQYRDDRAAGASSGVYTISVTVTDDEQGAASLSRTVTVDNVAPQLQNVVVTPAIDEDGTVTLTGEIIDPGTLDTFTLDVDWGDGDFSSLDHLERYPFAASPTGRQAFTLTHQYLDDDPAGTVRDAYSVGLTVTDDDGGSGHVSSVPFELLVNGSFETGDFEGWTTITTGSPVRPWAVSQAGGQNNVDAAAFPDNTDLTSAFPGVTLIADIPATPPGDFVTNSSPPGEPTMFIMRFGPGGSLSGDWTDDPGFQRIFQADFAEPTDFVSIDMREGNYFGWGDPSTGVLEAYDADGNLLDRVSKPLRDRLGMFRYQTLFVSSPSAEIASIRAYGTGNSSDSSANLSRLQFRNASTNGIATVAPQDGSFAAWNGFAGSSPIEFQMYQDVTIPAGATATLEWLDRVQWDSPLNPQPRRYDVEIRDPSTNADC